MVSSTIETLILLSLLGHSAALLRNVTKLGGNQEVDFPLQAGEIYGRMVIVDSRQVSLLYNLGCPLIRDVLLCVLSEVQVTNLIAAVSAQRLVEHVKNTSQNMTNEGTPQSVYLCV